MQVLRELVERKLAAIEIFIAPFLIEILFEFIIFAKFHLDFGPIFHYDLLLDCAIKVVFNNWVYPVVVLER